MTNWVELLGKVKAMQEDLASIYDVIEEEAGKTSICDKDTPDCSLNGQHLSQVVDNPIIDQEERDHTETILDDVEMPIVPVNQKKLVVGMGMKNDAARRISIAVRNILMERRKPATAHELVVLLRQAKQPDALKRDELSLTASLNKVGGYLENRPDVFRRYAHMWILVSRFEEILKPIESLTEDEIDDFMANYWRDSRATEVVEEIIRLKRRPTQIKEIYDELWNIVPFPACWTRSMIITKILDCLERNDRTALVGPSRGSKSSAEEQYWVLKSDYRVLRRYTGLLPLEEDKIGEAKDWRSKNLSKVVYHEVLRIFNSSNPHRWFDTKELLPGVRALAGAELAGLDDDMSLREAIRKILLNSSNPIWGGRNILERNKKCRSQFRIRLGANLKGIEERVKTLAVE